MPRETSSALQHDRDPLRIRLGELEARLADREAVLGALKRELLDLQSQYFASVGALYSELGTLDAAVADLEIALGLRLPPDESDDVDAEPAASGDAPLGSGCSNRGAPTADLKRVFRDLAKAIHPDRALDGPERFRRHSLMTEANRAYAERDEDRLRLILQAWHRSPDSIVAEVPGADRARVEQRAADIDARLLAIDTEFAELRGSAIGRLKTKMDEARGQGWDLLAEIVAEVKRQIRRASARQAALRRQSIRSGVRPE